MKGCVIYAQAVWVIPCLPFDRLSDKQVQNKIRINSPFLQESILLVNKKTNEKLFVPDNEWIKNYS